MLRRRGSDGAQSEQQGLLAIWISSSLSCFPPSPLQIPKSALTNASKLWVYYACVPLLLPRDFPNTLPLQPLCARLLGRRAERLVRPAWLLIGVGWLHMHGYFLPKSGHGASSYHLYRGLRGVGAAAADLWHACFVLFAVAAALPRTSSRAGTSFSWAGSRGLSFYLVHPLVTPFAHPHPYVYACLYRMRRHLQADRLAFPPGMGYRAGTMAALFVMDDAILLLYMLTLRFAISAATAWVGSKLTVAGRRLCSSSAIAWRISLGACTPLCAPFQSHFRRWSPRVAAADSK